MTEDRVEIDDAGDGWHTAFAARAKAHWTPTRLADLARDKALVVPPDTCGPLLRVLGLLHRDASMPPTQVRKYWQVAHMLNVLGPMWRALGRPDRGAAPIGPVPTLLDAGCGHAYLSLTLAYVARHQWGWPVRVWGVDRRADLIEACRVRAQRLQLDDVCRFDVGDVADVAAPAGGPLGVLALHACDTASCAALAVAAHNGATAFAVAPCCQAELARGWAALDATGPVSASEPPDNGGPGTFRGRGPVSASEPPDNTGPGTVRGRGPVSASEPPDNGGPGTFRGRGPGAFAPIWGSPHLRREVAAEITDAMRMELMHAHGFAARAIEFVPSEHTRKNTLLVGVRGEPDPAGTARYHALVQATGGIGLALADTLARR